MSTQISLMLAVEDAGAASAWYHEAFGATELWSLGSVRALIVEGAPFLLHETTDGFASPHTTGTTTVRIEIFTDEPDALFARAVAAGADGKDGVRDREAPWGTHRQGSLRDPFGHVWHVGDRTPLQSVATDAR